MCNITECTEAEYVDYSTYFSMLPLGKQDHWRHEPIGATLEERHNHLAKTCFAWHTLVAQVNFGEEHRPFRDPKASGERLLRDGSRVTDTRAQMVKYVVETFIRQHRVFFFTIFIVKREAWLMRWDRCGAVVSESFDYVQNPQQLLNFVYRVASASRAEQGCDNSAVLAPRSAVKEFVEYKNSFLGRQDQFSVYSKMMEEMSEDEDSHPLYIVCSSSAFIHAQTR
jgi:hypothetical protein